MQRVVNYRGYTLEITSVAVDVIDPRRQMYLATKVSLRDAMKVIHWHRRFLRASRLARGNRMT